MLYEYQVSRSVRYYPRFSVTSVGLGTYYPRIRRSTCNSLFGSMSAAAWIQTHQTLLSKWTGTEFTKDVNTSILEETQWRNLWRILTDWLKKSPFILVRHLTLSSATLIHSVPSRHISSYHPASKVASIIRLSPPKTRKHTTISSLPCILHVPPVSSTLNRSPE